MTQNIQEDNDVNQSKRPRLFTPKSIGQTFEDILKNFPKKLMHNSKNNTYLFNLSDQQSLQEYLNAYVQELDNGTIIRGRRHKGLLHGVVQIISQNGSQFQGIYRHGVRQSGLVKFTTGQKYCGGFLKNQFHGHGQLKYPCGKIIKALWENGITVGSCQVIYPQGDVYNGPLVDNKKHGSGSIIFSDNHKYEGQFHYGDITGYGVYFQGQNKITEGFWQKGVLLYRSNDTNCKVKRMNSKCLPDQNIEQASEKNSKISIKNIVLSLRNFQADQKKVTRKTQQVNMQSSFMPEDGQKLVTYKQLKSEKKTCCSIAYSYD